MKVIKEGVWSKRLICRDCGTVLQAEISDIQYEAGTEYENQWQGTHYVECPTCGFRIKLKSVPKGYSNED